MIIVESRRRGRAALESKYKDALILDVTSRGPLPWVRFSPFYPHGQIPVPFCPGIEALSVEGIWQGLKVFEREGVDPTRFDVATMRGLKRTTRTRGRVLGHRRGLASEALLGYVEARQLIYLPSYHWVLEHNLQDEVALLRAHAESSAVVLLDYETNSDPLDTSRPLSHAALVARYVEEGPR